MELYHVLNRGVDKRTIFLNERDYVRFVHDLYEFNDRRPANNVQHFFQHKDIASPYFGNGDYRQRQPRDRLVDLHGWCLMKNHYHLLLSERVSGGLTLFIRKLNIGFAKYFNEKYSRTGTLFQGRTKKILIERDAHFLHILHYIHLNPLDYLSGAKQWRTRDISNSKKALAHLEHYRWSSYADYCGRPNFPSILTTGLFGEIFDGYRKTLMDYLVDIELELLKPNLLE